MKTLMLVVAASLLAVACTSNSTSSEAESTIVEEENTNGLPQEYLGNYHGVQPGYNMKNQYGDDIIIGGQKIIVPDIDYKFLLKEDGIASLQQTNLEDNSRVYYEGKSKILSEDDNTLTIECSLKTADGKSNPTYKLIIIKSDQSAICMGTNEPKFNLKKV